MLDNLALAPGDTVTMTLIDRLARSTPDLLSTFAAIADRKAGSLARRHLGRNRGARPIDADRAWRASRRSNAL
jgi:hypothetical protein